MAVERDFSFFSLPLRSQTLASKMTLDWIKRLPVVIKADLIAAGDHVG